MQAIIKKNREPHMQHGMYRMYNLKTNNVIVTGNMNVQNGYPVGHKTILITFLAMVSMMEIKQKKT
jgi:hypothetical protein